MGNDIDWSATAAWIALIVAIISPIITTIISNIHNSKIAQFEVVKQRGLDIIEKYLAITSREILTTGVSDEYRKYYAQIFLYAPQKIHPDLEELNYLICGVGDLNLPDEYECSKLLNKISKALKYDKM